MLCLSCSSSRNYIRILERSRTSMGDADYKSIQNIITVTSMIFLGPRGMIFHELTVVRSSRRCQRQCWDSDALRKQMPCVATYRDKRLASAWWSDGKRLYGVVVTVYSYRQRHVASTDLGVVSCAKMGSWEARYSRRACKASTAYFSMAIACSVGEISPSSVMPFLREGLLSVTNSDGRCDALSSTVSGF